MTNPDVAMDLDEAVGEVLGLLTGLDLDYAPELNRYQIVTRQLNRALRATALDHEWSYYSSIENVGIAHAGDKVVPIRGSLRPRIINDDAIRLVHPVTRLPVVTAHFLPRDALYKYPLQKGLWASHTRQDITFSRAFTRGEEGLEIHIPVMREPRMFRLPKQPEDPDVELVEVPADVREQLLDFDYPDLVIQRAAYFYAQTDPIMQPRVQTLEENYKTLMYSLVERDDRNTDSPYQNEWSLGIDNGITGGQVYMTRVQSGYGESRFD